MGRRRDRRSGSGKHDSRSRSPSPSASTRSSHQRRDREEKQDTKRILELLATMREEADRRHGSLQGEIQGLLQEQQSLSARVSALEANQQAAPTPPATAEQASERTDEGESRAKRARSLAQGVAMRARFATRVDGSVPASSRRRRWPEIHRTLVFSGWAKPCSLQEFQAVLSPVCPDTARVYTAALYSKVAFVEFAATDERDEFVANKTYGPGKNRFKLDGQELWLKPMLPPEAVRAGYKLRSAQRWLLQNLPASREELAVCYRSSTVFYKREVILFFRDEHFNKGDAWPASASWQALLDECG